MPYEYAWSPLQSATMSSMCSHEMAAQAGA
jgi:hypothetical protein